MYVHFARHSPCLGRTNTDLHWMETEISVVNILKCVLDRHGSLSTQGRHTWECGDVRVLAILHRAG